MEEKKKFIINTLYIGIIIGILYLVYKYLLPIVLPFIFGFIFAYITEKITKLLKKSDKKYVKYILLISIYLIVAILGFVLAVEAYDQIVNFIKSLPSLYNETLLPALDSILAALEEQLADTGIDFEIIKDYLNNLSSSFSSSLSKTINSILPVITKLAMATPEIIVSTIVCIVTSFHFVSDYDALITSIGSIFNEKVRNTISEFEYFLTHKLMKILATYLLIMFITAVELAIGFVILKIESPVLLAAAVSIVDVLPVLGVGTILIPWGIIEIVVGHTALGVEILVLYLIITIIRNIIEPKMVGNKLKLHPLFTLFAMMVGLNIFGLLGMIGIPLIISFINNQKEEREEKDVKKEK